MWKEAVSLGRSGRRCLCAAVRVRKKAFFSGSDRDHFPKLERDRNLIFLSDLHNNEFGRDNGELVAAIHRLNPDAVLSGGDMMVCKGKAGHKGPAEAVPASWQPAIRFTAATETMRTVWCGSAAYTGTSTRSTGMP